MHKKGILEKCILHLQNLNEGTRYNKAPVGNSPEMMPLDCLLFEDLHKCVRRHVIYTLQLDINDNKNFSLATIKKAVSAYSRIWNDSNGEPTSERIVADIKKL